MPKSLLTKVLLVFIGLSLFFLIFRGIAPSPPSPTPKPIVQIGDIKIPVEIAETPEDKKIGLAKYTSLPESEGMLFPYSNKSPATFWMKGMSFPIDIIWIADGKVAQITEDVQHEPGVSDKDLKLYPSFQPVDYVLEVNAGFARKNNVNVGDSFVY